MKELKHKSLNVKAPLLFLISYALVTILLVVATWHQFNNDMLDTYTQLSEGVLTLMAEELNPDRIDTYIEDSFLLPEYRRISKHYYSLKANYPDVLYMYVYRIEYDGGHVVFDLNSDDGGLGDVPGTVYELDPMFQAQIDDLVVGNEIEPSASMTEDGYLFTNMKPVFDTAGNYKCHVGVDFSMERLYRKNLAFIFELLGLSAAVIVVLLLLSIYETKKYITDPITKLAEQADNFRYDTAEDKQNNVRHLKELQIHTGDEIEKLYLAILFSMQESLDTTNALQESEDNYSIILDQAYTDALTGVGNKAAFDQEIERLNGILHDPGAHFALVMIDINNLKLVNDKYGHETGDSYIRGSVKIMQDIFQEIPIYRTGGDEFVVILEHTAYKKRMFYNMQLTTSFTDAYANNAHEWDRYSASMGTAENMPGDESAEEVLKRADKMMYLYKQQFKKRHGSYR